MAVRFISKNSALVALAAALAALAAPQAAFAAPDGLESAPRAERERGGGRDGGWRGNRGQEGGGWSRPAAPTVSAPVSNENPRRGGWSRPEASAPVAQIQAESGWRGNRGGAWARPAQVEQRAQAPVRAEPQARSWSEGDSGNRGRNWRGNNDGWNRQKGAVAPTAQPDREWRREDNRRDDNRREDWRRERREDWRDNNNRNTWSNREGYRSDDSRYRDNRYRDNRWQNNNHHGYSGDYRRWSNDWRRDRRYDWYSYRNHNRHVYRLGSYYAPYRGYYYRPLSIGFYLDTLFFSSRYWINDPWQYRLPDAYGPYRWVRYYDDALLVNIYSGEVVDVIRNFFW